MFANDFARRIGLRRPTKSKARYLNLLPRIFERMAEKIHRLWVERSIRKRSIRKRVLIAVRHHEVPNQVFASYR